MEYTLDHLPAAAVLRFHGDLSGSNDGDLKQLFVHLTQDDGVERIVADMRQVSFLDSSVLGVFIWAMKNMREGGGDMRLFGLTKFVQRLFDITGLDQAFKIFPSESEALGSFDPESTG